MLAVPVVLQVARQLMPNTTSRWLNNSAMFWRIAGLDNDDGRKDVSILDGLKVCGMCTVVGMRFLCVCVRAWGVCACVCVCVCMFVCAMMCAIV